MTSAPPAIAIVKARFAPLLSRSALRMTARVFPPKTKNPKTMFMTSTMGSVRLSAASAVPPRKFPTMILSTMAAAAMLATIESVARKFSQYFSLTSAAVLFILFSFLRI